MQLIHAKYSLKYVSFEPDMLAAITVKGKFDTNGSYCAVDLSGNCLNSSLNQTLCNFQFAFPLKYLVIGYIAVKRRYSNSFLFCNTFRVSSF